MFDENNVTGEIQIFEQIPNVGTMNFGPDIR